MLKAFDEIKIGPLSWLKAGVYAGVLGLVYYTALRRMIIHDWAMEDYSHCYLIPFVVLYLIWEKRRELTALPSITSWMGLVPFCLGIALFWLGELGGEFFTMYISFWLVIVGLCWLHLGWKKIKAIWFALVSMLAMFPFPGFLTVRISLYLKLISSQIGVWMLHLYGMSAYREGNIIDLGFTQLQVVDACSGLRYLFPLLVMGILLAYFYRTTLWKRMLLVLSTVPLTIVTNSLRIALTGVIYKYWGAPVAEGFFHGFSGWLIFMFTLCVLLAEILVLRHIAPGPSESFFAKPETILPIRAAIAARPAHLGLKAFLAPPQFVVAAVLLIVTLGFSMSVEFREKIPASKPLSQFPLAVSSWEGTRQYMGQEFIASLDFSDYVIVDYQNSSGRPVNFYVAYYESQTKGASIHSPETCLPSSGWIFQQAGKASLTLPDGRTMTVNRAIMEKGGQQQISYFWFPARGRILTNAWEMKLYTFWDALTRQRTEGALVRVITPVLAGERPEAAEERLQSFVRDVNPILDQFLPK